MAFVLGFPSAFIPGFPSAFIPEYSITITFFVAVIGLLVTYYCKISEDKDYKKKKEENGYKKMKEEKDKEYAGNKKILTKKLKELEKVKKMIDGESDVYDKKRKTLTNEIELLGKKIEEVVKELGENSKDRRLSGKIGNIARGRGVQFRIFAAVFGIIAALAISAPIEALLDDGCESTPSQLCPKDIRKITDWPKFLMGQQVILTSGFFAIGILFYHGGILTLSGELAPLIEEGRKGIAFVSSLIVFVEGIILFVASSVTDDLVQFSYWICVLLVFDITWLIINLYARIDMTFQWLHMDVILLLFLVFAFLIPLQLDSSIMPTSAAYLAVFALFLLRSMIDYKIGWKYWTKVSTQ